MRYSWLVFMLITGSSMIVDAQNPDYVLEVADWTGVIGNEIEVPVSLTITDLGVSGWSFGVCHDPTVLQLESVEPGLTTQTANDGDFVDFRQVDELDDRYGVGVVVQLFPGATTLPTGADYELEIGRYTVVGDPDGATLCPCDNLGNPGLPFVVVVLGQSIEPTGICGDFVPKDFVRGDCNADGSIDLGDPIFVEQYLFLSGAEPSCHSACDTNDDGILDIADSIYLLNNLFVGGPPPPPPHPSCGRDLTVDAIPCVASCP